MNNEAKEERGQKEKLSLGEFFVMCSLFLRWFVKYMWGSRKMFFALQKKKKNFDAQLILLSIDLHKII